MSGCYGSSPEDKYFESLLFRYLEDCEDNRDARTSEQEEYEAAMEAREDAKREEN